MQDPSSPVTISSLISLAAYLERSTLSPKALGHQPSELSGAIAPLQVLTSRNRYQCCHIRCSSETEQVVPAIFFEDQYYSLLKTEHGADDAFKIATRLMKPERQITLTKIPKGYAIWILEPEAIPSSPDLMEKRAATIASTEPSQSMITNEGMPYKILTSEDQYRLFHLTLPHNLGHNVAVRVNDAYYRSFQVVKTIRQAAKTAKLLAHYGERSVITKMPSGYGIWRLDTSLNPHQCCRPYRQS